MNGPGAAPVLTPRILDNFAPPSLHRAVWETCMTSRWHFGNLSTAGTPGRPFWKMDLAGDQAVDALWRHSKALCEQLAGHPLAVDRQYANGHTFGLGGRPHYDDSREGTCTLLYYPMPEWHPEWEGETLYFDRAGNIAAGVAIAPNRGVFFDSRIAHSARGPSRDCPGLRVTVAFKLVPA